MAQPKRPRRPAARRPGNRAGLDAEQVLAAAREVVVDSGVEGLTMRRLADRLGVAPNAVYSHFADKAALTDAVLDSLLGEIATDGLDRLAWRDGLQRLMGDSRAMLLRHTPLLPHLMSRPMTGPNASRLGEATLVLLERAGITGDRAVAALRALLTFTFGSVVLDAPRLDARNPGRQQAAAAAFGRRADLLHVSSLAGTLARPPSDASFETSLGWLIDGIAVAPPE